MGASEIFGALTSRLGATAYLPRKLAVPIENAAVAVFLKSISAGTGAWCRLDHRTKVHG